MAKIWEVEEKFNVSTHFFDVILLEDILHWYVSNPVNNWISTISSGDRRKFFHQQYEYLLFLGWVWSTNGSLVVWVPVVWIP